jgi:signal transduction histidine kinase
VTNQPSQENLVAAKMKGRAVNPVQQIPVAPNAQIDLPAEVNYSKIAPAEAEFRQLVGNDMDGTLARFLQNRLRVMFWHRPPSDPQLVFGAQLELNRVITGLRSLVRADLAIADQICLVLLDERARPVVATRENFQADWKRPFVAAEIGDALPHWEVAAYFVNPASLQQTARTVKLTLGLLIATLVVAVAAGGWLIFANLNRQLTLARQKTDFVSNVSHELKTPLTSIRMFSELLSQGRVVEPEKQKSYLNIITAEAARLTRLINNVLDFSRMERGEKKYNLQDCDLADIARATADALRPHLENTGFRLECSLPASPLPVRVDSDALAQVIMNLLSNAEKYSDGQKTIELRVNRYDGPIPYAEVSVLDRGMGVPGGSGEKIFEKFYRAHDSLSSGIQGSGLGLTLARQIARAHGGDVSYEPREGGGSCFSLRLPLKTV